MKKNKYLSWLLVFGLCGGCSFTNFNFKEKLKHTSSTPKNIDSNGFNYMCRGTTVRSCNPRVLFNFDSTELTSDTKENFDWIVRKSQRSSIKKITIEAHTDITGTEEYNIKLSEKRAEFAKQKLIESGVSAEKIKVLYYGKSQPLTLDVDNQEINRRVTFKFN